MRIALSQLQRLFTPALPDLLACFTIHVCAVTGVMRIALSQLDASKRDLNDSRSWLIADFFDKASANCAVLPTTDTSMRILCYLHRCAMCDAALQARELTSLPVCCTLIAG